jgi:glycolate oxidase
VVAVVPSLDVATAAVEGILAQGTPSLLEMMDRATIRAVEDYRPSGLDTDAAALVIARSDLPGEAGQVQARAFEDACVAAGATETYRSETEEESEALLEARRMALPAIERLGYVLIDDVAVPRGRLGEMVAAITRVAEEYGVGSATVGHAGDGNLHPHFIAPHDDEAAIARTRLAFYAALDEARALGGTVTGEHGVGALKRLGLRQELDPTAARLHGMIKQALDPQGILNPGKGLPLEPDAADSLEPGG